MPDRVPRSAIPARSPQVRPLTAEDHAAVLALLRATPGAPAWSDAEILSVADGSAAQDAHQRLGWAAVGLPADAGAADASAALLGFAIGTLLAGEGWAECELEYLAVSASSRRQGVGRLLLGALVSAARQAGAQVVRLEVRASNVPAARLYEQAGFRRQVSRRGYYRHPEEDALLFQLDLVPV